MGREGDRRIVLREPGTQTTDALGAQMTAAGTEHVSWAIRRELNAQEGLGERALNYERVARFEVRQEAGLRGISARWTLVDEAGLEYGIERVQEVARYASRKWLIEAVRKGS